MPRPLSVLILWIESCTAIAGEAEAAVHDPVEELRRSAAWLLQSAEAAQPGVE